MSENFHEQLSAHFDGEESTLRSDTPFSSDQQAALSDFEQIRKGLAAPVLIDTAAKDRQIAAALQTFDPAAATAASGVLDLNTASQEKSKTEPARRNHQKWFTLAAAFIVCVAGVFAFYRSSSFFDNQRDTASESVAAESETSDSLQLDQQAETPDVDEGAMLADAGAAEESMQEPSAAPMQDFASDADDEAAASPENKTALRTEEQSSDAMEETQEAAPATTTTALFQTTIQPPLATVPSYTPKKYEDSSNLERNVDLSSSICAKVLQEKGFSLHSYSKTKIDGVSGELFFLANKTASNEIFVDRNCVQYG